MRWPRLGVLGFGVVLIGPMACGAPDVPAECEQMCDAAAALYGACLSDLGLDWSAAGYANQAGFLDSCQTWAWEQALVHDDALASGATEDEAWLLDTCAQRTAAFEDADATCVTYTSIDWSEVGWR